MKSDTFRCPYCKGMIKKSDADLVLGDEQVVGFAVFGSSTAICPHCAQPIDRMSIIEGKYDDDDYGGIVYGGIGFATLIGTILLLMFVFDFRFWPAVGISYAVVAITAVVVAVAHRCLRGRNK